MRAKNEKMVACPISPTRLPRATTREREGERESSPACTTVFSHPSRDRPRLISIRYSTGREWCYPQHPPHPHPGPPHSTQGHLSHSSFASPQQNYHARLWHFQSIHRFPKSTVIAPLVPLCPQVLTWPCPYRRSDIYNLCLCWS